MNSQLIDKGNDFDFGRTSAAYAAYRDIYPKSMYDKLISFGIGKKGQQILDLGSGTAVLPVNLSHTGAQFVATDISENQVAYGKRLTDQKGIPNIRFKVCSAEETGFADNSFDVVTAVQCFQYFDAEKAADEITRVLKPQKLFCKIFMDWLPLEDAVIAEMEKLVLQYNGQILLDGVDIKDVDPRWLHRTIGVGASLPEDEVKAFEREYRERLKKYAEPLRLKHQIHIEIYRSMKQPCATE